MPHSPALRFIIDPGFSQRCRKRSALTKSGKIEIPDTPEANTSNLTYERSQRPAPVEVASASHTAAGQGPLPWFQTSLVAATPKIKQKKVGAIAHLQTSCPPNLAADSMNLSSSKHAVSLCHDTDAPPQMLTRKLNSEPVVPSKHGITEKPPRVDVPSRQTPQQKQQPSDLVERQGISKPRSFGDSHSSTNQGSDQSVLSVFSATRDNSLTPGSASDQNVYQGASDAQDPEPEIQARLAEKPATSQVGTIPPKGDGASIAGPPETHTGRKGRKRYTNRELARIALVAGNGQDMATSQIIPWLVRTFPHLRVGEGNWEMNVRSALSWFEEFEGRKIHGAQGNKKLYGFSSAAIRAQFEAEYAQFVDSPGPHQTPVPLEAVRYDDDKPQSKQPQAIKRAVKSAPTSLKPMIDHRSKSSMVNIPQQPSPTAKPADNRTSFNPFERSVPRQPCNLLNSDSNVLEFSRKAAIPAASNPTIDNMTEEEKARKIKEIKARPSRKSYFGSEKRLAHKRRYDLEDIHDERDGAWQAPGRTTDNGPHEDHDMDIDGEDDGHRTLRKVFNLPYNMIPVNDGQTELAFKDGEKGKRSRTMFKVGKMFGGELTVRTS